MGAAGMIITMLLHCRISQHCLMTPSYCLKPLNAQHPHIPSMRWGYLRHAVKHN